MSLKGILRDVFEKAFSCVPLKTGQTTSYHAGDDGDLQRGVSRSYTVLDTGQYSGTTDITINGKTHAASNACVKDNRTGLEWHQEVIQADIGPAANGNLFWEQWTLGPKVDISFTAATKIINSVAGNFDVNALCVGRKFTVSGSASNDGTYTVTAITANNITVSEALVDEAAGASVSFATVADLIWDLADQANANKLGGYSDWRIPTILDYINLTLFNGAGGNLDSDAFPSAPNNYHYSSTTQGADTTYAFHWNHALLKYYASVSVSLKTSIKNYVRLVRGGFSQ